MNRLRQWRQRVAYRRKSKRNYRQWLGRQPANHVIGHIELVTASAKWLIALHGAGLAASIAFMIAAYTSLPGALDHACVAVKSISDSFRGGQVFGQFFVLGGAFALPAAAMPGIVRFGRNCVKDHKRISSRIENGKEIEGLTHGQALGVFFLQLLFLAWSASVLAILIWGFLAPWAGGYLGPNLFTSDELLRSVSEWEKTCSRSSSPLKINISPSAYASTTNIVPSPEFRER